MAGTLTYADLRFARSPPESGPGEEPHEAELTYENVQAPGDPEKEAAERGPPRPPPELPGWTAPCPRWRPGTHRPTLGALAACLVLLATSVALGVQYLRATRQLQRASDDHAAERRALQGDLEEGRKLLRRAEEELHTSAAALRRSQAAENRTRLWLQRQELLLGQANRSLAALQGERAGLEADLSRAVSCRRIGCCPSGWALFRWKCLWASGERRSWMESRGACERKSSRLLVPEPWSALELWEALREAFPGVGSSWDSKRFWVGLRRNRETEETWKWVDGSPYKRGQFWTARYSPYASVHDGGLSPEGSSSQLRYICEKAASPEAPLPLSDGLWRGI